MRYQFAQISHQNQIQWMVERALPEDGWCSTMYRHRVIDGKRFTLAQLSALHVDAVYQNQPPELLKWICAAIDARHQALAEDRYIFRWRTPEQLEYMRTQDHENGLPFIPIHLNSHAPHHFDDLLEVAIKQEEDPRIIAYLRQLCTETAAAQ
jgi:hypothetical protein